MDTALSWLEPGFDLLYTARRPLLMVTDAADGLDEQ
jgi:hypothetical protein